MAGPTGVNHASWRGSVPRARSNGSAQGRPHRPRRMMSPSNPEALMKRSPRLAVPLLAAGLGACMDAPTAPVKPPSPEHDASPSAAALDPKAGLADAAHHAPVGVTPPRGASPAAPGVAAAFRSLAAAARSGDAGAV